MRVFPVKAYAFVNFTDIASAIKAMATLDGVAVPMLTGAGRRAASPCRAPVPCDAWV